MSSAQQWALIVGALMPALIAVVQQKHWPAWFRVTVATVSSIAAGLITVYIAGSFTNVHSVLTVVLIVLGAAVSFYNAWWKPLGLAPWLETLTSRLVGMLPAQEAPAAQAPAVMAGGATQAQAPPAPASTSTAAPSGVSTETP